MLKVPQSATANAVHNGNNSQAYLFREDNDEAKGVVYSEWCDQVE